MAYHRCYSDQPINTTGDTG